MLYHADISDQELHRKIKSSELTLGGNSHLRIFGALDCWSGKRMKRENRVFFMSREEALEAGYRPCGHCMKIDYDQWKPNSDQDLFPREIDPTANLLSGDSIVNDYGQVISFDSAVEYFSRLCEEIQWRHDEAVMFGKKIVTKRKVAWYGSRRFEYAYSNTTKVALPWVDVLVELKQLVEQRTGEQYNSCLLNLYHNGSEGMAWHSDDERDLKPQGAIASLSFGAERKFSFKHKKTKKVVSMILRSGNLIVMKGQTQDYWMHRLPPTKVVHEPRINLTFRTIVE